MQINLGRDLDRLLSIIFTPIPPVLTQLYPFSEFWVSVTEQFYNVGKTMCFLHN